MHARDLQVGKVYDISYIEDPKNPGDIEVDYVGLGRLIYICDCAPRYRFDIGFGEEVRVNAEHIIKEH